MEELSHPTTVPNFVPTQTGSTASSGISVTRALILEDSSRSTVRGGVDRVKLNAGKMLREDARSHVEHARVGAGRSGF